MSKKLEGPPNARFVDFTWISYEWTQLFSTNAFSANAVSLNVLSTSTANYSQYIYCKYKQLLSYLLSTNKTYVFGKGVEFIMIKPIVRE